MGWFLWLVWSAWFIWFGRDQPETPNKLDEPSSSSGDHWSDFDLIAVVQHFVFRHQIVAFDHEMRFDDEAQLAQEVSDFLGAFDFNGSGWMAQLDLHGKMIRPALARLQENRQHRTLNRFEDERFIFLLPAETSPILPAPLD
jgi:hypothetical protein